MWLSDMEIQALGFRKIGQNVLIDSRAIILGAGHITIGSHTRIDALSLISAGPGVLRIGSYVHLAANSRIYASAGVDISDFANLSSGVCVYSISDDFTGGALTGPTVPSRFRDVTESSVFLGKHVIVGANSVILPGVHISEGAAVGALSLVRHSVEAGEIVAGTPASVRGSRPLDELRRREKALLESRVDGP